MIKNINIGKLKYKLEFYDKIFNEDDDELFGHILYGDQKIKISRICGKTRERICILHECVHGLDDQYGFGFNEDKVRQVATLLYDFMVDNKELVKYIIGDEKVG